MTRDEYPTTAGGFVIDIINSDGAGSLLRVCEHAFLLIPEKLRRLLEGQE